MRRLQWLLGCGFLLASCATLQRSVADGPLVTADWVRANRGGIVLVDMQSSKALYEKAHIPGAVYVNIEELRQDKNLPPVERLEQRLGSLGIDRDTQVVVYDERYGRNAGWLWFVLTQLGHERIALLDGHLDGFRDELVSGPSPAVRAVRYRARRSPPDVVDADWVLASRADVALVDARIPAQYTGEKPKKGMKPGHIPGATNLPWTAFRAPDGRYLAADASKSLVAELPRDKPIVLYCNSYHAAAHVHFQLARLGFRNVKAFDGSMRAWTKDASRPLETGR